MKIYIDEYELGHTITYKEEYGKKNYLYNEKGFEFESLQEYKDAFLDLVPQYIVWECLASGELTYEAIGNAIEKLKKLNLFKIGENNGKETKN